MTHDHYDGVTPAQAERLLTDVINLSEEPGTPHLSPDDLIQYAMETLPEDDIELMDQHLMACTSCTIILERLLDAAAVWQTDDGRDRLADLQGRLGMAVTLARTLLWVQVVNVVVFTAAHLSRTRRQGMHFQSSSLFQHWVHEDMTCVLSEEDQAFVFSVDTTDPQWESGLVAFALEDADTGEDYGTGLVALYPDSFNDGHFIGATQLRDDVVLPEQCQPRLARVVLDVSDAENHNALLDAAGAAYEPADVQAWKSWAQRAVEAGSLTPEVASAIMHVDDKS